MGLAVIVQVGTRIDLPLRLGRPEGAGLRGAGSGPWQVYGRSSRGPRQAGAGDTAGRHRVHERSWGLAGWGSVPRPPPLTWSPAWMTTLPRPDRRVPSMPPGCVPAAAHWAARPCTLSSWRACRTGQCPSTSCGPAAAPFCRLPYPQQGVGRAGPPRPRSRPAWVTGLASVAMPGVRRAVPFLTSTYRGDLAALKAPGEIGYRKKLQVSLCRVSGTAPYCEWRVDRGLEVSLCGCEQVELLGRCFGGRHARLHDYHLHAPA